MKKFLLAALGLCANLAFSQSATDSAKPATVAIVQFVEHPSLNAINQGIQDELKAQGLAVRYEQENSQGQPVIAQQIVEKFLGLNPTVVVAIATPAAQAAANVLNGKVPLVFASITDPVAAKLVPSLDKPGKNITGTMDAIPLDKQLAVVREALPQLKKLGTVYNPGDANASASVAKLKDYLKEQHIELVEAPATKSSEVQEATASLAGVDGIFIVLDNTAVSALDSLLAVAREQKIPVFSADVDSVQRGTVLALGFDYYDVGRDTGQLVAEILKGKAAGEIPVRSVGKFRLVINPAAAKAFGLALPDSLIKRADTIINEEKK